MDFVNGTRMNAAYTKGVDPDGRERLVVVVKGTFEIPRGGGDVTLCAQSDDLVAADVFTGKPGFSAVVYESDFAPSKARCDVLVVGSAHAPRGVETTRLLAGFRFAALAKGIEVVGDRHWIAGVLDPTPSAPKPFRKMPITYDRAFGGPGDASPENPSLRNAYAANPVGVGYFKRARTEDVFGRPVPNLHETNDPVTTPKGSYRPMSFGPVGRNFAARVAFAGTYDQHWYDDVFPFLPADFDPAYYQAAPHDQQVAYPSGGESLQLMNLTPHEQPTFRFPKDLKLPVEFTRGDERIEQNAVVDTVVLEPDRGRVQLVWRTSLPLLRSVREVRQVIVGAMTAGWYRARERRKVYYTSLGALVADRRRRLEGG